jgi:hypothetical protein
VDGWIGLLWAVADGAALYGGGLTKKKTHGGGEGSVADLEMTGTVRLS